MENKSVLAAEVAIKKENFLPEMTEMTLLKD